MSNSEYLGGILTSNLTFGSWDSAFAGDGVLTVAIFDRVVHHSIIVSVRGESFRLKHKRNAGLSSSAKPALKIKELNDSCCAG